MRRYESVVILDPDLPDDEIVDFTDQYSSLIKTGGGEVIKIEDWGPKKLAYLVKKRDKGRYILFDYVGMPTLISEIERRFKISDAVLKFLSVKLDEDVDLEAFKAATEEAKPETQAPTEPVSLPEPAPEEPAEAAAPPEAAAEETGQQPEEQVATANEPVGQAEEAIAESKEPAEQLSAAEPQKEGEQS